MVEPLPFLTDSESILDVHPSESNDCKCDMFLPCLQVGCRHLCYVCVALLPVSIVT